MTNQMTPGMTPNRGMGDEVIYARRPLLAPDGHTPAEHAGWITWIDTLSGTKLRDYTIRGFTPLMKYGVINRGDADYLNRLSSVAGTIWERILQHPDGPAEFPVEQIITGRWYRPEFCPVPGTVFPQLTGQKVREYRCPECRRPPFVGASDEGDTSQAAAIHSLGMHLRIMHGWDRPSLMAYGDRINIDFNEADAVTTLVQDFEMAGGQAKDAFVCDECGATFSAKIALAGHKRSHPLVPVEVI